MSELHSNLLRLFVAKQHEPVVLCSILFTDLQFMLYLWYTFTSQRSDHKSFLKIWIAFYAFLDFFPLLSYNWRWKVNEKKLIYTGWKCSVWLTLFYWFSSIISWQSQKHSTAAFSFKSTQTLRSTSVAVFTESWIRKVMAWPRLLSG